MIKCLLDDRYLMALETSIKGPLCRILWASTDKN